MSKEHIVYDIPQDRTRLSRAAMLLGRVSVIAMGTVLLPQVGGDAGTFGAAVAQEVPPADGTEPTDTPASDEEGDGFLDDVVDFFEGEDDEDDGADEPDGAVTDEADVDEDHGEDDDDGKDDDDDGDDDDESDDDDEGEDNDEGEDDDSGPSEVSGQGGNGGEGSNGAEGGEGGEGAGGGDSEGGDDGGDD